MHIQTLLTRRSGSAKSMTAPGPTPDELQRILTAAARVPDHGKLAPWWFITFEGDARATFGDVLADAWQKRDPNATPTKLTEERTRLLRAPLVIAVISRPRQSLIPVWEQILSAGAACYNACLAANALGYAANWLTQWYAFDDTVRKALKLDDIDTIAGFIYIGTAAEQLPDRPRPDLAAITNTDWQNATNRGDIYAKDGVGYVHTGFTLDPFSNA